MRDPHHPVSIKTSPPSLEGVIERARLISALAQLPAPAKWLQSPSGTGKSTLAASYARSRNKPLVWYRLDERDNDPAFFYDAFSHAIAARSRATQTLPRFSSDDHERQQQFAHRFTTALGSQLTGNPALIILDDAHRVTDDAMQSALAALVSVAHDGSEIVFVSESTAPTTFFDSIAARRLALLNDADLHFNTDECRTMTTALRVDSAQCDSIAALTGGHAGALVLACELLRGADPQSAFAVQTVGRIHTHLLSKLIERMPPPQRELLLQTAFVTQLTTPIAAALASGEAVNQLDALVERGLLRQADTGECQVYEAHGLVRSGMQTLVRAQLGAIKATDLAQRTATVLVENDQHGASFELLVQFGPSASALQVLRQLAERYAADGHVDLLMNAIGKLPVATVQADAWISFWAGQAQLRIDEERSRVWLAHSYAAFEKAADRAGMRLAAASVVIAFGLEHADLRELDTWIQRHRDAGGETLVAAADRFEPTLLMAIVCVALIEGHYPEQLSSQHLVQRLQQLLELDVVWLSDDQRVQAGRLLITHARIFRSHIEPPNAIIVTRRLIQEGLGGSLHRGRWLIDAAYAHFEAGDSSTSFEYLQQARKLAVESNSTRLHFELGFALANHWMKAQLLQDASEELGRLKHLAEKSPPAQRAEFARMTARLLLLQDRHAEGLRYAEDAMRLAVPAGFTGANLARFELEYVYAMSANDQLEDALVQIKKCQGNPPETVVAIAHCIEFLLTGATELPLLRVGLENAQKVDFLNLLDRARRPLVRICEAALANDVETAFVHRLIAVKKLRPSPRAGPSWPWPVRIRTLGGFRLEIGNRPYRPPHKAQDKPLELLKLLITCQALGRESADKAWILERLWADKDAVNARKSLDMTISRLRKLLECEESIAVSEGRIQLSPTHAWTDIISLRHALAEMHEARDDHATGRATRSGQAAASISAVLAHYKGAYLAEEDGPPWLLAGREAIASGVRHALFTADRILNGSDDAQLIPALQRALLHDPTSEDLARSLMCAHVRHGQNSEALGVYRRLRDMLSLLMGLAPSAETEQIRNRALSQEARAAH